MITIGYTTALIRAGHDGQTDRSGLPFHQHPERVLQYLLERWPDATADEQHAALLHDVLEDTEFTAIGLRCVGYPVSCLEIVCEVTRSPQERLPYLDWVQAIVDRGNLSAIRVKWADNRDNRDPAGDVRPA